MAVQHIVWIKFNADVSNDRIDEHLAGLRSLEGEVPGITALMLGENFTDRAQGYTHGLIVTLTDREALATYATHPYHVKVAEALREDSSLLALDFEF